MNPKKDKRLGTNPGSNNAVCPSSIEADMLSPSPHCLSKPRCMWPNFRCPYTPEWMLFSMCKHTRDARCSMIWHGLRSPFILPYTLTVHCCKWEQFDHHLSGCLLCGKVHRCDTDQTEEVLPGDKAHSEFLQQVSNIIRCPIEYVDDGSMVCRITGVCVRSSSYAFEYELLSRQGLTQDDMQCMIVMASKGSAIGDCSQSSVSTTTITSRQQSHHATKEFDRGGSELASFSSSSRNKRKKQKQQTHQSDSKKKAKFSATTHKIGVLVLNQSIMKKDFHEDNIAYYLKSLLTFAGQDNKVLFSRYCETCEKRDTVLQQLLAEYISARKHEGPVCMLTIAAKLEHRLGRKGTSDWDFKDSHSILKLYSDEMINDIVEQVKPSIYRLFLILKTLDCNKYKGSNIQWMILGMLYICTSGMTIGYTRILPCIPVLRDILPNDNRIYHYFGHLGIHTKCVTDMSNMISQTLKNKDGKNLASLLADT